MKMDSHGNEKTVTLYPHNVIKYSRLPSSSANIIDTDSINN